MIRVAIVGGPVTPAAKLVEEAVYGPLEPNRPAIREARLAANPGCYPAAVLLGFLPLLENDLVALQGLIADAKPGASGAGRKAVLATQLCEAGDNFKAYSVAGHRHEAESVQGLSSVMGHDIGVTFVPHLLRRHGAGPVSGVAGHGIR